MPDGSPIITLVASVQNVEQQINDYIRGNVASGGSRDQTRLGR
jgi:hypothetical protein